MSSAAKELPHDGVGEFRPGPILFAHGPTPLPRASIFNIAAWTPPSEDTDTALTRSPAQRERSHWRDPFRWPRNWRWHRARRASRQAAVCLEYR